MPVLSDGRGPDVEGCWLGATEDGRTAVADVHPSDPSDPDAKERDETATEGADRNWNELLQELRVVQTGLQILTGFLLTVPFQQRFVELSATLRSVFLVALSLAVLATALVVAPVASHRVLFRRHAKSELVEVAHLLTQAGLTILALTIAAVLVLVFGFVVGQTAALVAAGVAVVGFVLLWVVAPVYLRRRLGSARRQG